MVGGCVWIMPVTIFERPYQYLGPYPFSTSGTVPVQISGILIEQAQYAIDCELSGYFGSSSFSIPKTYYRFLYPRIPPTYNHTRTYKASYSGINLGGIGDDPPCSFEMTALANIDDTRDNLLDIFIRYSWSSSFASRGDSDWHRNDVRADYFMMNFGDNKSGSVGQHRFTIQEETSGIHDISIREISYQPYVRWSRSVSPTTLFGILWNGWTHGPIYPKCMTTNGEFPYTKQTGTLLADELLASTTNFEGEGYLASGIEAQGNNEMLVLGDMMFSGITKLRIGSEVLTCKRSYPRFGPQKDIPDNCDVYHITNGFGYFDPPSSGALETGVYTALLYQDQALIDGIYNVKSGVISAWPPYVDYNKFDGGQYELLKQQAFEVMLDGAFKRWSPSGMSAWSAYTNTMKYIQTADQTVSTVLSTNVKWSDAQLICKTKNGENIDVIYDIVQSGTGGWNPIFGKYNSRTLDLVSASAPTNTHMYGSPSITQFTHFFYIPSHSPSYTTSLPGVQVIDLTGKYVFIGTSGFAWVFDSNLQNLGCFSRGTKTYAPSSSGIPIIYYNDKLWGQGANGYLNEIVFLYDTNEFKGSWPYLPSGMHIVGGMTDGQNARVRIMSPSGGALNLGNDTYMADTNDSELNFEDGSVFVNRYRLVPTTSGGSTPIHLVAPTYSGIEIDSGFQFDFSTDVIGWIDSIT